MTIPDTTHATLDHAHEALERLRALPLEADAADAARAVEAALADARATAREQLFAFVPVAVAELNLFSIAEPDSQQTYAEDLARLHRRALNRHESFSALLRHPVIVDRVRAIGTTVAIRTGLPLDDAAERAAIRYELLVASDLAGRDAFEPAASVLVQIPALEAAIASERDRRQQYREAELARVAAEQQAAASAVEALERERRAHAETFFARHAPRLFVLRGSTVTGQRLAEAVRGGQLLCNDGHRLAPPSLDELELLVRRTEAADAVTA